MPSTGNTQGMRLRIRPPTNASASVPSKLTGVAVCDDLVLAAESSAPEEENGTSITRPA